MIDCPDSTQNHDMQPLSATIFWPKGCAIEGICYGWLKPTILVAGVLHDSSTDNNMPDADVFSVSLANSESWTSIKDSCGGDPIPIGRCTFKKNTKSHLPSSLTLFEHKELVLSYVFYDPHSPQSMRFYVMDPPADTSASSVPTNGKRKIYDSLAKYDFTHRSCRDIDQAINGVVINQINASSLLQTIVHFPSSSPKLLPTTASILLTLASHLDSFSTAFLSASRIATQVTNWPINPFSRTHSPQSHARLKDVSAVVQQMDVRIEQAIFFITHVTTLNRRNTCDTPSYSVRYTNFFNTVWLMMNDITLGLAAGAFLSENNITLASYANTAIQQWLFDFPRAAVYWLDAWPAGLKLNAELSRFYVNVLIGIIDTWHYILPLLTPYLFTILGLLASIGGLTLMLATLSDLISFVLTAHLRVAYELTRAVYWAAGVRLGGGLLWGVFRGKRRNILRNRTDTWSYDIDQLLFGTVLFTLLAFLFPTALVYYMLFAGLRLGTMLVQASIETLLAFMHHFPLFALMLRGKDPQRLPGGIYFSLKILPASLKAKPTSYLILESQPIPLSAIFFQFIELWHRLAVHYNPLRLLYQVLAGQHLSSIPQYRIRYAARSERLEDLKGKMP